MSYEKYQQLVIECRNSGLLTKNTEAKVGVLVYHTQYIRSITCHTLRLLLDKMHEDPQYRNLFTDDASYIFDVKTNENRAEKDIAIDLLQGCIDRNWNELCDEILDALQGEYRNQNVRNFVTELRMSLALD